MPHMARVTTVEIGNPMSLLVLMEADYGAIHSGAHVHGRVVAVDVNSWIQRSMRA